MARDNCKDNFDSVTISEAISTCLKSASRIEDIQARRYKGVDDSVGAFCGFSRSEVDKHSGTWESYLINIKGVKAGILNRFKNAARPDGWSLIP
eukprot:971274-Prorocentrum_minimum.AAC.4